MIDEKNYKPDPTKIGVSNFFDYQVWLETVGIIKKHDIPLEDVIENFMLFFRRVNFAKFVTHIEVFKKTVGLPGSIVECGVFKGMSLLTFAKLVEVYCPGDTLKKVYGFDTFEGFVSLSEKDGDPDPKRDKVINGWNSKDFLPALNELVGLYQKDSVIPRFTRLKIIKGDVKDTIPEFLKNNPGLRISLLHLDMDLYDPTLTALKYFYPLVVKGGVVLLDEYGMEGFPGETAAVDDFFGKDMPVINKFGFTSTPGGFFVKEE